MILFLVCCKQSISEASEAAKTESVGAAAEVEAARLSTEAEQKVTGLAPGPGLLMASKPRGGAGPLSAEAEQGIHSAAADRREAERTSVAALVKTSCNNINVL